MQGKERTGASHATRARCPLHPIVQRGDGPALPCGRRAGKNGATARPSHAEEGQAQAEPKESGAA
eukprot:scaffold1823_cov187-Isochrysis_galbana.AAC.1